MEIKVEHLSYNKNQNPILLDINMKISSSMITTLLGSSGSGKSTLLTLFQSEAPTNGSIYIENINIWNKEESSSLKNKIGYLPFHYESLFIKKTVGEQLLFYLHMHSYQQDMMKQIMETLSLVNLNETYFTKKISELSNSERKRVALASILVYDPTYVVLDEPMQDLHPCEIKELEKQLFFLRNIKHKTILVATKNSELALRISDYIYIINQGKIIEHGDKISVLKKEKLLCSCHLKTPKIIHFSNVVNQNANTKIVYRSDINDLIKDIYRAIPKDKNV